jgi:hypothetical protein
MRLNTDNAKAYSMCNIYEPASPLTGLARLFKMAFDGVDLTPLGEEFVKRAQSNPDDAEALMDLAVVLQLKYQKKIALDVQSQALGIKTCYHLPAEGEPSIRLLALMAPGDMTTNTPLEFIVQNSSISLDMLYIGPGLPFPKSLPEHDIAFVAIGESKGTHQILEELSGIIKNWPRPVLNQPLHILRTSREAAPEFLAPYDNIIMPSSVCMESAHVRSGSIPVPPFLIRPVGSHAGHGLAKIDDIEDVGSYLQNNPEEEFYISPFIDYRSPDGLYRKYRVVLIGGKPFACHMGVSENWMIHYLNAGMTENKGKREQEAKFIAEFNTDFALRHHDALRNIHAAFDLDYLVIDCAETPDGKLLVFEVDTGAVVHAMDPPDIFPYKVPQMKKVFSAFHDMLVSVAYECESV